MNEKVANKYFFKPHFWSSCWNVHLFYQSFKPCSVSVKEGFTKPVSWKTHSRVSKNNNLITCETFPNKDGVLESRFILVIELLSLRLDNSHRCSDPDIVHNHGWQLKIFRFLLIPIYFELQLDFRMMTPSILLDILLLQSVPFLLSVLDL